MTPIELLLGGGGVEQSSSCLDLDLATVHVDSRSRLATYVAGVLPEKSSKTSY